MLICTWNIQLGRRLDRILEAISSQPDFAGLDMMALQEASVHDGRTDAEAIAAALGPGYRAFQAMAQHRGARSQANALVWRDGLFEPSRNPEVVRLPGRGAVQVRRVERTLLRAAPPQERMALCVESDALRVYVLHLDVIGFTHKLEQFKTVVTHMTERAAVPLEIIAGDLNTFGPAHVQAWRRLAAAARSAGLVNVTAGIRRTHWTGQKLDAIYARAATPLSHRAWTLKVRASDHLPVFAEIDRRAN
jgi:endonuclease/exonuclease/phosphatase family metal-dependent hydrolase